MTNVNAFEVLGIASDADIRQVREAYRRNVKKYHPDLYRDALEQDAAQQKLVAINLAYEQAMRQASQRKVPFHTMPVADAKAIAAKLLDQQQYESALCQLGRADGRDEEWFYLQGMVLMGLKQYDSAHQSFREAVRLAPENLTYRRGALDAAVAVRRHQVPLHRLADSLRGLFGRGKK